MSKLNQTFFTGRPRLIGLDLVGRHTCTGDKGNPECNNWHEIAVIRLGSGLAMAHGAMGREVSVVQRNHAPHDNDHFP